MEAALASALLKVAGDKLVSLIKSEFASITGVKKDLTDLQDIHGQITNWLSQVHHRSIETNPQFRWVIKLKDVAYDIDDLIHEVELEAEKHKVHSRGHKNAIADNLCAKAKSFLFRCKVARKIKDIKVGYAAIVAQTRDANALRHNLQLDQYVEDRSKATGEQTLLCDAEESQIPVRDQLKTEIVSKLVESNQGEDGRILSIVGLGGSGKTTLAQHICQDNKVQESFKGTIFWVHVSSQEFCMEKLIGKLFEAITKQKSDRHTLQYVVDKISSELHGMKFLLVMDDAWHDKRQDWEQFMKLLNSSASGSMILLTTRDQNVAKVVESKIIFNLAYLTEAESRSFFLKSSYWVEEDLNYDFIQVGKDIVKKCGGVPLAIKTLGGVLRDKTGINTWRAIRKSNLWDEKDTEGRVFASLKLSYIHLKDLLKQCFVFCSIFPKGYLIRKDYIIEQWMAHGFIRVRGEEQPDDIGSEYFDSLVKACFLLQDTSRGLVYKMHDLIHDLARYILQNEVVTSLPKNVTACYTQKCRYLSLTSGMEKVNKDLFEKARALHASDGKLSFDKPIKKSCYIRSVVVDNENFIPFPKFILKLEYLRYLEMHKVECTKLPELISGCWNLHSLHFIGCKGFTTLPESVGRLKKLRTLELNKVGDLECLPKSIGDCRDLQSLQVKTCIKLIELPTSAGKIENLREIRVVSCRSLHKLSLESNREFNNLQTINLAGCQSFQDLPSTLACRTLRTLNLSSTDITMLPEWVTMIDTLECIDLESCQKLVELPKDISNLKRLAVLNIVGCIKLRCMPSGLGQLTRLRKLGLFIVGCGEDDARISELESLSKISGDLEITNLKYLKDPVEPQNACLNRKTSLQSLVLVWSASETEQEAVTDVERELGVINALEPPCDVGSIDIRDYGGLYLPRWMMKQTGSPCWEGMMLEQASPCQFPYLTRIRLERILNLKHMSGLMEFCLLKHLELFGLPNLEELCTTTTGFETGEDKLQAQYCFPVLSNMSIARCPKLNVKPHFPPSLEVLRLSESNEQLLSLCSFAVPSLKSLALSKMTGPSSGWEFLQNLTALENLDISSMNDLTRLPESMGSLTSLNRLCIDKCPNLGILPRCLGQLRSLQILTVSAIPMLDSLPQSIEHLTSLVRLHIYGWDNLKQLPDAVQHLTSLETLHLLHCGALSVLPEFLGELCSLRMLCVQSCPALQCLPQSIQSLTALHELQIYGCPGLAIRCKQGVGPDWHLISHVPCVDIDD